MLCGKMGGGIAPSRQPRHREKYDHQARQPDHLALRKSERLRAALGREPVVAMRDVQARAAEPHDDRGDEQNEQRHTQSKAEDEPLVSRPRHPSIRLPIEAEICGEPLWQMIRGQQHVRGKGRAEQSQDTHRQEKTGAFHKKRRRMKSHAKPQRRKGISAAPFPLRAFVPLCEILFF